MNDPVNHPAHYTATKFQVWDILDEWFPTCPLLWNVGKYIARADHKGNAIQDLKKARAYLDREIDRRENSSDKEDERVRKFRELHPEYNGRKVEVIESITGAPSFAIYSDDVST